jgi:hypothetical protein
MVDWLMLFKSFMLMMTGVVVVALLWFVIDINNVRMEDDEDGR